MPGNCFNASEASFPFVLFRRCRRVCPLRTNPFVEWNKNSFFFLLKMIAMRMPGLVRQRTHIAFTFLCEYYTTWRGRPWTYDACYNVRTRCRQFSSKISLPDSSLSLSRYIYSRCVIGRSPSWRSREMTKKLSHPSFLSSSPRECHLDDSFLC